MLIWIINLFSQRLSLGGCVFLHWKVSHWCVNVVYPGRKMDIGCVSPGKVVTVLHSANAPLLTDLFMEMYLQSCLWRAMLISKSILICVLHTWPHTTSLVPINRHQNKREPWMQRPEGWAVHVPEDAAVHTAFLPPFAFSCLFSPHSRSRLSSCGDVETLFYLHLTVIYF